MSDTLKDKILDKIVDGTLNLIADTSKAELTELIENNKLQKILEKTILNFYESSFYKREYKNVGFEYDKYCVYELTDEQLNPANTVEQIASAIYRIIPRCFSTDDESIYQNISNYIANLYLERAKVSIQLYDIIKLQHECFSQITEDVSELKKIILSNYRDEIKLRQEKEVLLKKELNNEVISIISEIATNYLFLVLKKGPQYNAIQAQDLLKANISTIESILEQMDEIIKEDFCSKPICANFVNGLEFTSREIGYFEFSELFFRNVILRNTEKLLKYKDIMDDETFVNILRLRNEVQGVLFPPLISMGQTNIVKNTNIKIDVNGVRNVFTTIGKLILSLYKSII